MRILIDTNIIIKREDNKVVPSNLAELLGLFNSLQYQIFVHPYSIMEINKDKDEKRKQVNLSKVRVYTQLYKPPRYRKGDEYENIVGKHKNDHDFVDNCLLYSVYKYASDFLITEDKEILAKAERLSIDNKVFNINEAILFFKKYITIEKIETPESFKLVPCHSININDSIFDSLKEEYNQPKGEEIEFEWWWREKCVKKDRNAWVYQENNETKAILIFKTEQGDFSQCSPPLEGNKMLKVCLFKVSPAVRGHRIGERFIRMAVDFCIKNDLNSMYLTHFTKENDDLVPLIEKFGFYKHGTNNRGEDIFVKHLVLHCDNQVNSILDISKAYYPSFYHGKQVKKFVVPIIPEFHERLFPDYVYEGRQKTFFDEELNDAGNSIKKAYLCNSKIKDISPGDILLFYRSHYLQGITALGVVESVHRNQTNAEEILKLVSKRTVYSQKELEEKSQKPTLVILFWYHFYFFKYIKQVDTLSRGLLKRAPQSIMNLSHDKYLEVIDLGGLDERFTIN